MRTERKIEPDRGEVLLVRDCAAALVGMLGSKEVIETLKNKAIEKGRLTRDRWKLFKEGEINGLYFDPSLLSSFRRGEGEKRPLVVMTPDGQGGSGRCAWGIWGGIYCPSVEMNDFNLVPRSKIWQRAMRAALSDFRAGDYLGRNFDCAAVATDVFYIREGKPYKVLVYEPCGSTGKMMRLMEPGQIERLYDGLRSFAGGVSEERGRRIAGR